MAVILKHLKIKLRSISHFTGRAKSYTSASIDQYLVKEKLLINRLKENKCEICGITTWQEKPIVIQLHHINGNPTDNRIENLQMLCPNCHSQTENYARKESINKPKNVCSSCGKQIERNSTYCKSCAAKYRNNNLEIPSRETLKELLLIKSFTKRMELQIMQLGSGVKNIIYLLERKIL